MPMIRRDGGPAKTNTDGEYRILLTATTDAAYTSSSASWGSSLWSG